MAPMPKRKGRGGPMTTSRGQAAEGSQAKAAEADAALTEGGAVDERGAFAVARCDRCGWQGAARRSRERARKDLRHHLEDKPKHADHVSLTDVPR